MSKHTYFVTPIFEGNYGKPEIRHTEKGYSDLANRLFVRYERKYGEDRADAGLTVEVTEFDSELNSCTVCTYHA